MANADVPTIPISALTGANETPEPDPHLRALPYRAAGTTQACPAHPPPVITWHHI